MFLPSAEEELATLLRYIENRDWNSFNLSAHALYEKMSRWIKEDNATQEEIHALYHRVAKITTAVKEMKEEWKKDLKIIQGSYLDLDDLTFYY